MIVSILSARKVYIGWENAVRITPNSKKPAPRYLTEQEDMVDAFYQTLMLGNISPTSDRAELREQYLTWSRIQRPLSILDKLKLGFVHSLLSFAYLVVYQFRSLNVKHTFQESNKQGTFRCFVETDSGYIGVASGEVKVGDQVWLLKGGKVPIVLRARGDGHGWEVVGDVYMHVIMYGEAFVEEKCRPIVLV
jgi:hypothetical protein